MPLIYLISGVLFLYNSTLVLEGERGRDIDMYVHAYWIFLKVAKFYTYFIWAYTFKMCIFHSRKVKWISSVGLGMNITSFMSGAPGIVLS